MFVTTTKPVPVRVPSVVPRTGAGSSGRAVRCVASSKKNLMTSAPSKRTALALAAATCVTLSFFPVNAAYAASATFNQPTDPSESPLIQELLRRTEEKKSERVKERLDDYNKRNFKDYFDVVDIGYRGKEVTANDLKIREQLERWKEK